MNESQELHELRLAATELAREATKLASAMREMIVQFDDLARIAQFMIRSEADEKGIEIPNPIVVREEYDGQ